MSPALYLQISEDILRKIEDGRLPVGGTVPSIQVLREQYRTSHVTALRAFKVLSEKGMIQKRPGMGYVVAPKANTVRKLRSLGGLFRNISNLSMDQYYNSIMGTIQQECATAGIVFPCLTLSGLIIAPVGINRIRLSFFSRKRGSK